MHTHQITNQPVTGNKPFVKASGYIPKPSVSGGVTFGINAGNQFVGRMLNRAVVQKKSNEGPLYLPVSPVMARAMGSVTIDGFITGKAHVSKTNKVKLKDSAYFIKLLTEQYPGSSICVEGHTDAVGDEKDNTVLGQQRADNTAKELVSFGVDASMVSKESKGETELLVKTGKPEARNRRAEVVFKPYVLPGFMNLDLDLDLSPPQSPNLDTSKPTNPYMPQNLPTKRPSLFTSGPAPSTPEVTNWLETELKKSQLLHLVPKKYRPKVVNALKDGDEKLADLLIGRLGLSTKYDAAVKAVVKTVLQLIKGKKFKMPPSPSWRQMPVETPNHSPFKPFKAEGEKIFTYDVFKF